MADRVVFRRFTEGDLVALFPDQGEGPGLCNSYQHVGQHGAASLELMADLAEVDMGAPDVLALWNELVAIGYKLEIK